VLTHISSQEPERHGSSTDHESPSEYVTPSTYDQIKDGAGVAWSFTQLLLKKAPVMIDSNPIKIAFGIAQIALELKKVRVAASSKCRCTDAGH
jgi:hypothetical protein